ncbi:FAD-dependent oxidoreductase, partial [bacterium]|nr:FAD-dependent oxidoreductase [bacterium]
FEDIRKCLACNQGCIERLMFEPGSSIRCAINPETGQELIYPQGPAEKSRKVWIVGAGPAGLVAAYESARLGHKVTLFEKTANTGGQIKFASQAPVKQLYGDWISWLAKQVEKMGVEIKTDTEVTETMLNEGNMDVVILAIGGENIVPEVKGLDQPMVCDATGILSGDVQPGKNVLIIGGGLIGMETADFLAERGSDVTIVEMQGQSPVMKFAAHGYQLHKRLRTAECGYFFNTQVESVQENSVTLNNNGKNEILSPIDQVVLAVGMKPRQDLKKFLLENNISHYIVGDASKVRRIIEATGDGAKAAWDIQ